MGVVCTMYVGKAEEASSDLANSTLDLGNFRSESPVLPTRSLRYVITIAPAIVLTSAGWQPVNKADTRSQFATVAD